jgi:hypothetical protein
MGKNLTMLGIALGTLPALLCCAEPGTCDVSTNDGVRALYTKLTKNTLDTKHECIERSTAFPGLVRVGVFFHDRGCRWKHVIVGCQIDPQNVGAQALALAGWGKADVAARQRLALAWLQEGEGIQIDRTTPDRWIKSKPFTPPAGTATANGGLTLRYWTHGPIGMQPILNYTLIEMTFAADGSHDAGKPVDSVEIKLTEG